MGKRRDRIQKQQQQRQILRTSRVLLVFDQEVDCLPHSSSQLRALSRRRQSLLSEQRDRCPLARRWDCRRSRCALCASTTWRLASGRAGKVNSMAAIPLTFTTQLLRRRSQGVKRLSSPRGLWASEIPPGLSPAVPAGSRCAQEAVLCAFFCSLPLGKGWLASGSGQPLGRATLALPLHGFWTFASRELRSLFDSPLGGWEVLYSCRTDIAVLESSAPGFETSVLPILPEK